MHDFLYKDSENLFITQLYIFKCLKINCDRCDNAFVVIFFKTIYIIKQLLDSVSVISLSLRLRLTTLTSTLIIPDITKPHPIIVYSWRLPSLFVTALHPPYSQNRWGLLKFILTRNVLFHLLPKYPSSHY